MKNSVYVFCVLVCCLLLGRLLFQTVKKIVLAVLKFLYLLPRITIGFCYKNDRPQETIQCGKREISKLQTSPKDVCCVVHCFPTLRRKQSTEYRLTNIQVQKKGDSAVVSRPTTVVNVPGSSPL